MQSISCSRWIGLRSYLLDTYIDAYVGFWGQNVLVEPNTLSGNELDYYGGFAGAVPLLEDYFSYDVGFYTMIIQVWLMKTLPMVQRNVDFFEYYASVGLAVPNPITDIGVSYYYGYSTIGFQRWNYDYHNVGMRLLFKSPFTISGAAGFTGNEMEGGNAYYRLYCFISTSAFRSWI